MAGITVVIEEITDLKRVEQHLAELKRQAERDITELKRVNEGVKKTADRLKAVFDSIDDMICVVDRDFNVVDANKARLKMFKLSPKDAIEKKCYKIFQNRGRPCKECPVQPVFKDGKATRMEKLAVIGGVVKYFDAQGIPIFDEENNVIAAISFARDVTEKKQAEEALRECSIKDELTGLFNYRYFQNHLEEEIKRAQRYEKPVSLILLDLDNFKTYNDSCGHLVGNEILKGAADPLRACVRDVDIVARYGGDEFCVILPQTGKSEAIEVAERIRTSIEHHDFPQKKKELGKLTVSLGLVAYPQDGKNLKSLLGVADKALYMAKNAGGNRIVHTVLE
ncbi:MAG: GGDEF domain-containing protein [Actinomycetota bacterium]|nr:GGDEF domain-containing protein [Actinomycetota bacterium]